MTLTSNPQSTAKYIREIQDERCNIFFENDASFEVRNIYYNKWRKIIDTLAEWLRRQTRISLILIICFIRERRFKCMLSSSPNTSLQFLIPE